MPKICVRHSFWHLALFAAIAVAIPAAYAAPQDSPAVDSAGNTACASLGVYIFVGGRRFRWLETATNSPNSSKPATWGSTSTTMPSSQPSTRRASSSHRERVHRNRAWAS